MNPIPIIFLDANSAFRRLAVRVLERHFQSDITVIAEGEHWPLEYEHVMQARAVLLGLGSDGLIDPKLLAEIQSALPRIPIVVLGHLDDPAYQDAAFAAGADAFVSKNDLGDALIPVLRRLTSSKSDREAFV